MAGKDLVRRALLGPDPEPKRSWEVPVDTRKQRTDAVDLALVHVEIATRNEQDEGLRGDYLEFGVFRGETFAHAHHRGRQRLPWMRYFAFDSFEGLPAPEGVDAGAEFAEGQFACSQADFEKFLNDSGADSDRIVIVPGWFDDSLVPELRAQHELRVCTIAYIDCDLYQSAVPVLEFLTPLVRQGTILLFDDWYCFRADPGRGVQRAASEWLEKNPHLSLDRWHPFSHHGQSFFVQTGGSTSGTGGL